jgi:hypothetical protein
MGHGWFVVGADSSHRTSHFARAHVHADLSSIESYSHAVRRASILGNGLISADGGDGGNGCCGGEAGGGGGGRISIIASEIAPTVQALGGAGLVDGAAGTIFETRPCQPDFNRDGGVDGADIESFFVTWATGEPAGDYNQDGGVDGSDIAGFFQDWEAGC